MKQTTKNRIVDNVFLKYLILIFLFFLLSIACNPAYGRDNITNVDVILSQDRYQAGDSYPVIFRIRISSPWYIHSTKQGENSLIPTVLSFSGSSLIKLEDVRFPSPSKARFKYSKEPVEVFSDEILVRAKLVIDKKARTGKHVIKGQLSYQACSSKSCLPPEDLPILASLLIAPGAHVELKNQEIFDSESPATAFDKPVPGWKFGAGILMTLAGIFLGGLALNLTPCIYPLIPITVSYFGGKSDKIRGRTIIHGLLYILGLAFTNSLLGLAASLSGGILGSTLQNPVVLIVVAGILVALGLSFFGLWEFKIPPTLTSLASKSFGGYFGTFFMGLTLGIVAAPCLGPFILGLLTYVGQQGDPFLGFLCFFVLSIGMGLPLAVLAMFSGTIEKLPVSGEWMVWIRKVLGWVLFGMAGYLLQPLIPCAIGKVALLSSILIAAGVHLGWLDKSGGSLRIFQYVKKGLGVILIAGSGAFFLSNYSIGAGIHWITYDHSVLMQAVKEKKPVILDFYADWCGPCVAMEKNVFTDPEVMKASHHFVTLRIDLTKRHPYQAQLQEHYKIRGVPTIIFINRLGVEERTLRIESFTDREQMLGAMKRLIAS